MNEVTLNTFNEDTASIAEQESKSKDFKMISDFKGEIFGVATDNQAVFISMSFLHDVMLERPDIFDDKINIGELVIDLMEVFERLLYKTELSDTEIENELLNCIERADSFSELRFEVFYCDYYFSDINEKIKNGGYLIKNT